MRPYQICTNCIMDTTDPDIVFDEQGVCNHCHEYKEIEKKLVLKGEEGERKLKEVISLLKVKGKNNKYDCLIGISGGVDSTYLAYFLKKQGLRPLAVHFDYGWDSEIAVKNIENLVTKLDIDLYTYVIDWDDFKDLQYAYIKASVIDIDVPADQLIFGALFKVASKNNIKYVISGNNVVTETILPKAWYFQHKFDLANLKAIHKAYGTKKVKNYPSYGKWQQFYYSKIKGIQFIRVLNYIPYIKKDVMKIIQNELGWRDYGGKHYESVFTRFYQGYILPKKFNIDKRKAHLSSLVVSGQMSRNEALEEISKNSYTEEMQESDKQFFIKKFGFTEEEFENIMNQPVVQHENFPMEKSLYQDYPFLKIFKPLGDFIKK
jgi:N-acetyl sugar amidotransferase